MTESSYQSFLRERVGSDTRDVVAIYHAVRNIPYGSTGERDPVQVITNNLGSCSGKHVLLRDLLRETGRKADVVTMFTFFNRGIPSHPAMPAELREMVEGEEICDFHHYVRLCDSDDVVRLDATWHDALIPYGFPVNHAWQGHGDTVLAAAPEREYPVVEDLAAWKQELLTQLTPEQQEARSRFFQLLTEWMMTLPGADDGT